MTPMQCWPTAMLATLLAACGASPTRDPGPAISTAHDNLNAVLWMQTAAEYEAAVRGVYASARTQLDVALADPGWSALPPGEQGTGFEARTPAIIVDADETMIDNTPYFARMVRDGAGFDDDGWPAWVNEQRARALPGAIAFTSYAAERGVPVYFVTNRDATTELASTVANLRTLGFPIAADAGNVLLRGDLRAPAREKGERRRWVGAQHRVLLVLGDNLGDFMDGVNAAPAQRQAMIAPYTEWWGRRWLMLPNPAYGSWETVLLRDCPDSGASDPGACKRQALRFE